MQGTESLPSWAAQAIIRVNRLKGVSYADIGRRKLARNLIQFSEIDDPGFPVPTVSERPSGQIHLRFTDSEPERNPRILEFQILWPREFKATIWRPDSVVEVIHAKTDHIEQARRLFAQFWPTAYTWSRGEMNRLAEVAR